MRITCPDHRWTRAHDVFRRSHRTATATPRIRTHPADGALFLVYITLIWTGMILGFGREIARHIANHEPPYPAILHVHSAVFVTWLVAFTMQILLVRVGKTDLHRRLGLAGDSCQPVSVAGLAAGGKDATGTLRLDP